MSSNLKSQQFFCFSFSFFKAHRLLPRRAETYSMRVGAIGPKLDGHGTEDAELARHLVHPTQSSLLIRVCKLDHQTGRGTLQGHDSTHHKVSERRSPLLVSVVFFFRDGDGFF